MEEDLGGHWDWLDGGTLYYTAQKDGTDEDQVVEEGFQTFDQGSLGEDWGLNFRLRSGTQAQP